MGERKKLKTVVRVLKGENYLKFVFSDYEY